MRVINTKPHATRFDDGMEWEVVEGVDGFVSPELSDEQAARYETLPGYVPYTPPAAVAGGVAPPKDTAAAADGTPTRKLSPMDEATAIARTENARAKKKRTTKKTTKRRR